MELLLHRLGRAVAQQPRQQRAPGRIYPGPRHAALRDAWFTAEDLPAQKTVADSMQRLGFQEPPFIPLGQFFVPYAYRSNLTGFVPAPITAFWNVRRS